MYPHSVNSNFFQRSRSVDHSWQTLVRAITLSLTHNTHYPSTACRASKGEGGGKKGAFERSKFLLPSIECSHLLPSHRRMHSSHDYITLQPRFLESMHNHSIFPLGSIAPSYRYSLSRCMTLHFKVWALYHVALAAAASSAASSCGFASLNIPCCYLTLIVTMNNIRYSTRNSQAQI
jgi:hypothetical protein